MFDRNATRYDTSRYILSEPSFLDRDPRCEWCECSMVGRFGEEECGTICESCEDDFDREMKASGGMIEIG
jgi:hypothetical protein